MIILTGYLSDKEKGSLTNMLKQHDDDKSTSLAMGRKAKSCYFLEENSDTAILLSRLFQKFGGKINTYQISDTILQSDIPRKYYNFTDKAFNKGNFRHKKWRSSQAKDYGEVWEILGFTKAEYEDKTNGDMLIQTRTLENNIKFGFGGI